MRVLRRRREQEGAGVVLALGMVALLVLVAVLGSAAAALVLTHRQAQNAADLAALAGAAALVSGADGCGRAAAIAGANRADLRACVTDGTSVLVTVAVELDLGGRRWSALGRARAGPAVAY